MKTKKNKSQPSINSFFKNKKGATFWVLVEIIIALFVLIIIVGLFFPDIIDLGDMIKGQQQGVKDDSDGDGFLDFQDECPCTYGDFENEGCPANLNEEEIEEENNKYNLDTKCGVISQDKETERQLEEIDPEQRFKHYRSIELFGDYNSDEIEEEIANACTGMVGRECESNGCSGEFDYSTRSDACLVMMIENDWGDDCGQAFLKEKAIIPLFGYNSIQEQIVPNSYFSSTDKTDPYNLLTWKWASLESVGSLICNKGFWFGCSGAQEGRTLVVDGVDYLCKDEEWTYEGMNQESEEMNEEDLDEIERLIIEER